MSSRNVSPALLLSKLTDQTNAPADLLRELVTPDYGPIGPAPLLSPVLFYAQALSHRQILREYSSPGVTLHAPCTPAP